MHAAIPTTPTVDLKDLITKADAARLRGITAPSFLELLERHPDELHTYKIGGVEFVFRSEVTAFKTKRRKVKRAA